MSSKPKLGQNFLRDTQAIERIANALGDVREEAIVEIGPGQGAITRTLSSRAAHVFAIELDRGLAGQLRSQFPAPRVTVIEADVLKVDFAELAARAGKRLAVAGNLPYYITSPILLKLAQSHAVLDRAVLMVQREVADRIVAAPGSRDYGVLSVTVQLYGPVEPLFTLPPSAFSPPPDVHSTVVRWRFSPRFAELNVDPEDFLIFVRQAFAQKRKTLINNLRAAGYETALIHEALGAASVQAQARAEALPMEQLAAVWKNLSAARTAVTDESVVLPEGFPAATNPGK
jgi:16S rRNA (adenine1518-N6/adenine1519-N6)-dimethyltransferase